MARSYKSFSIDGKVVDKLVLDGKVISKIVDYNTDDVLYKGYYIVTNTYSEPPFDDRSSIINFDDKYVIGVNSNGFNGCNNISTVNMINCSYVGYEAFMGCSSLTNVSLPKCTIINEYAFNYCPSLQTFYVGTEISTVCELRIGNYFGTTAVSIYVPSALVEQYKVAPNWSQYASLIKGV